MEEGRAAAAVGAFYEAATGAASWDDAAAALRAVAGARSVSLSLWAPVERSVEMLCAANVPDADWAARAYVERFHASDVWTLEGIRLAARDGAAARAWLGEEVVPAEAYRRSEFYNDFAKRLGVVHLIGAPIALGGGAFAPLGLHRPEDAAPFAPADAAAVDAALPHIRRALLLHRRLRAEAAISGALDAFGTAAVVVDAEMRVVFANAAAERLAAAGGGLRFRRGVQPAGAGAHGGGVRLEAARRDDAPVLRDLVRAVALRGAPGGGLQLARPSANDGDQPKTPLAAMVSPLPARLATGVGRPAPPGAVATGFALVLARDLARPTVPPDPGALEGMLGLTPAEAAVAAGLASGTTAGAVAAARGVSVATVRGHVRSVLEKTGAANLRDLERIVAALPGR